MYSVASFPVVAIETCCTSCVLYSSRSVRTELKSNRVAISVKVRYNILRYTVLNQAKISMTKTLCIPVSQRCFAVSGVHKSDHY